MRIVVVEDEDATREGLVRLIRKMGEKFTVIGEADNGLDGMRMIRDYQPDVVITDVRIPKMNGLDMVKNARACSPNTKYLVLSGYAEFDYAKQAIQLSVEDYLLKPITAKQLLDSLNAIYDRVTPKEKMPEEPAAEDYPAVVARVVENIKANYAQKLYLEDFANELKMTPEYLGAIFSKSTGLSFNTYLRNVRMERAKELLRNTDDKIYEIAYKTGYPDAKYFCRVFKEYTGESAKSFSRTSDRE